MDAEEEWAPDEDVSATLKAKILTLKLCRNRSLAHASSDKALDILTPVLKMLVTLLDHNGSCSAAISESEEYVYLRVLDTREVLIGRF
jgi:sister-chromatid-cohesion protein PDS5